MCKYTIIMSCRQPGYPGPSLASSPYRSSPLAGLQGYIPYPHIVAECMFKLVALLLPRRGQHRVTSCQWHFHQDNAPVHNSILVRDYLTKMSIKTVPQPPYSPDLAPCDFWLYPKLRGCRYETIEEMKEAVTKVIDTLTQEDLHGAIRKLLERYNKCIVDGGDYFEGE